MKEIDIKLMSQGTVSGHMIIDLDVFMGIGQITRVKKLKKIIYNSQNPEILWDLQDYVNEKVESNLYYNIAKAAFNEHVNLRDKMVELEEKVSKLKDWIDEHQYTKGSMWFNEHMLEYKELQQELKNTKRLAKQKLTESNKNLKMHQFYQKAQEVLK